MLIYGRNPLMESLKSPFRPSRVYLSGSLRDLDELVALLEKHSIPFEITSRGRLDQMSGGEKHQGIVAHLEREPLYPLKENIGDFLKNRTRILLILDRIQDPRNLGSIIRTASLTGTTHIIATRRASAGLTPAVVKASAGAIFHVKLSLSDSIKHIIESMREKGIHTMALERGGIPVEEHAPFHKGVLVVGSEHYGIRQSVLRSVDVVVSLRQNPSVNSYNVSVATGIALYILNFIV